MTDIHHLLLAGGGSSRMGRAKQLLPWGETSLIEHQIRVLLETGCPVSVVLGAYSEEIVPCLREYNISVITNKNWNQGMATSITSGVRHIMTKDPTADGILISLVDQPLITAEHFKKMIDCYFEKGSGIVVSKSEKGIRGVPVLFHRNYFEELMRLKGDEGAKNLVVYHIDKVAEVNCLSCMEDMDRPESYKRMLQKFKLRSD